MLLHRALEVMHSLPLRPLVQRFHMCQLGGILVMVKGDRPPLFGDNVCSSQGPTTFAITVHSHEVVIIVEPRGAATVPHGANLGKGEVLNSKEKRALCMMHRPCPIDSLHERRPALKSKRRAPKPGRESGQKMHPKDAKASYASLKCGFHRCSSLPLT